MTTVLISGAASGIGQAFLQHYASDSTNTVIAIDRAPVATPHPRITTFQVDVSLQGSISSFVSLMGDIPIQLLIHSVGVRGLVSSVEDTQPDDVAAAEMLSVMDAQTMLETYQINTIGTFELIRALLPNLQMARADGQTPKVVVMGSRMGSLSYNTTGSAYAYRASKAALNAIMKSFSIDVPSVIFVTLHPGRVGTGLVKTTEVGAIDAAESVQNMVQVMDRLEKKDSGLFYDRFGNPIGW